MWFQETLRMEDDIRTRRYFVLQVKRFSFLTDRDQNYVLNNMGAECGGQDRTEKVLCSPSKVHYIVNTSRPNLRVL